MGQECTRCLGTGIPEHFDMNHADGFATCPACGGSGVVGAPKYLTPKPPALVLIKGGRA